MPQDMISLSGCGHACEYGMTNNLLNQPDDEHYMRLAMKQAIDAFEDGEVPVGAVAVREGIVIARARNQVETLKDATAHAEMIALTQCAAAVGDWRLNDVVLYVTKEPCAMCAGGMVNSRLGRLVFGASDTKYGAAGGALNVTGFPGSLHQVKVKAGVLSDECAEILRRFFQERRKAS